MYFPMFIIQGDYMYNFKKKQIGIYEKALPKSMSWNERLSAVKKAGYDFIEISIDESDERLSRLNWDNQQKDKLKKALIENELRMPSMCLSGHRRFPLGSKDDLKRSKAKEIMLKAIEFADYLGIRVIQLAGYDVYYEKSDKETKELFLKGLNDAVTLASRAEVTLAIEIMDTKLIGTINKAMKYVNHFKSPWLKIYPDIGNLTQWAEDPAQELEDGIEHIVAIHVKDTKPGKFKEVPFGEGTVNFEKLFRKLNVLNYEGPFLIEMWADDNKRYDFEESIKEIKQARAWVENKMNLGGLLKC